MNPVFEHKGGPIYDDGTHIELPGWYFWCEDECSYCGPYDTEQIANDKAVEYGKAL